MKSLITSQHSISVWQAIACAAAYFLLLLVTTFLDIVIWRKLGTNISVWLNLVTMVLTSILFVYILMKKTDCRISFFSPISIKGVLLAIACAALFYIVLDKCLDPLFESIFPMSEADYQDSILTLRQSPVSSFLRVCLVAPVIEETLMRGYILGGLQNKYGVLLSLMISSILFAGLHFNMVQTLSALVCGVALGILYINTKSLFCCILTHFLYNAISYVFMIYPIQ